MLSLAHIEKQMFTIHLHANYFEVNYFEVNVNKCNANRSRSLTENLLKTDKSFTENLLQTSSGYTSHPISFFSIGLSAY